MMASFGSIWGDGHGSYTASQYVWDGSNVVAGPKRITKSNEQTDAVHQETKDAASTK